MDSVDPVDAWVIFSPDAQCWTDELPFWKRRLAKDFRHCWVILRGNRAWAGISSAAFGIEARVFDCEPAFDLPAALERSGCRVVHVRGDRPIAYMRRGIISCVSVAKQLIGLRAWHIITPRQLWKYLQALEAEASDDVTAADDRGNETPGPGARRRASATKGDPDS